MAKRGFAQPLEAHGLILTRVGTRTRFQRAAQAL